MGARAQIRLGGLAHVRGRRGASGWGLHDHPEGEAQPAQGGTHDTEGQDVAAPAALGVLRAPPGLRLTGFALARVARIGLTRGARVGVARGALRALPGVGLAGVALARVARVGVARVARVGFTRGALRALPGVGLAGVALARASRVGLTRVARVGVARVARVGVARVARARVRVRGAHGARAHGSRCLTSRDQQPGDCPDDACPLPLHLHAAP